MWCMGAGSGSAFVNVRLGYVQNRRDKPEKWGTCHPVAATAGIAGVECSTSGVFFQTFPNVGPLMCSHSLGDLQCACATL